MIELILGPPGTGKTTSLIKCVDQELQRGTHPNQIAYVSFTKRASYESVERACKKFNLSGDDLPYFRTLHALCYRALGLRKSDVFEGERIQEWARYAKTQVSGFFSDDGTFAGSKEGDRVLFMENLARVRRVSLEDVYRSDLDQSISLRSLETLAASLRKFKKENALFDFTDMLEMFVDGNISVPLQVLLVDEAQDLSALQWSVVDRLREGVRRTIVAGDDDQAIYAWAGADVKHLIDLKAQVRVLDQSWRVPKQVQAIANKLLVLVKSRREKKWRSRIGAEGQVERVLDFKSIDLNGDDIMILARNSFVLKNVENDLRQQAIIYEKNGNPSVKKKYLDAMLFWERLRKGEFVAVSNIRKVYDQMSSGKGVKRGFKKQMEEYGDDMLMNLSGLQQHAGLLTDAIWHEALDRIPVGEREYMLAARQRGESFSDRPRVRVSTIHTAKGAEAKHVVLMLEVARRTDREAELRPDDELRVWYVAVTRAKERLTLVEPQDMRSLRCKWL